MSTIRFQIVGLLLAAALSVPAIASEAASPLVTQAELRSAIDSHLDELKEMFPTLQGVGTNPAGSEVVLTILSESSTPEGKAEQTEAAKALLGVPVRLMVVPVKLTRH